MSIAQWDVSQWDGSDWGPGAVSPAPNWLPQFRVLAAFNENAFTDPATISQNMLSYADMVYQPGSTGSWTASSGTLGMTNTGGANYALQWAFTTTGAASVQIITGLYGPVITGDTYTGFASVTTPSVTNVTSGSLGIVWSNGAATTATSWTPSTSPQAVHNSGAAPSGGVSAALVVTLTVSAAGTYTLLMTTAGLWLGSGTTFYAPGALGPTGVWTDISQWTQKVDTERGRQHELNSFDTGTATIDLWNADGRFSDWNTTGPYFGGGSTLPGNIRPGVPIQVTALWQGTWWPIWTGLADSWAAEWTDEVTQVCELTCSDAFEYFNLDQLSLYTSVYAPVAVAGNVSLTIDPFGYWRLGDPAGSFYLANSLHVPGGQLYNYALQSNGTGTLSNPAAMPVDPNTSYSTNGGTGWLSITVLPASSGTLGLFGLGMWVQFPTGLPFSTGYVWYANANTFLSVAATGTMTFSSNGVTCTTTMPSDGLWHFVWCQTGGVFAGTQGISIGIDGVIVASTVSSSVGTTITALYFGANSSGTSNFDGGFQDISYYGMGGSTNYNDNTMNAALWAAGAAGFQQNPTGTQIAACLATIGWPSTAENIDAGNTQAQRWIQTYSGPVVSFPDLGTLTAFQFSNALSLIPYSGTTCLQLMQQLESTELGALFMSAGGWVRYYSRRNRIISATLAPYQQFGDLGSAAGNLLTPADASFENDTTGSWTPVPANLGGPPTGYEVTLPNCSLSVTNSTFVGLVAPDGAYVMVMAPGSASSGYRACQSDAYPVTAGSTYTATVQGRGTSSGGNLFIQIVWYDMTGTVISVSSGGSGPINTGAWGQVTTTAAAPANTASAAVLLTVLGASVTAYIDEVGLIPGTSTTWVPGAAEIPFDPSPQVGIDALDTWNQAVVTRQNGSPQVYQNLASDTLYGLRSYQGNNTPLMTTDAEALYQAQWIVNKYNQPVSRVGKVTVKPHDTATAGTATLAVLSLECIQKIAVNRHTVPGGGSPYLNMQELEGIKHHIDATTGEWTVELATAIATPGWILGISKLNQTTWLAY